jgi:DNA repair protein RAD50
MLKQHAMSVGRLTKEVDRLERDVQSLEQDLATTGSIKTADDVQLELDELAAEL